MRNSQLTMLVSSLITYGLLNLGYFSWLSQISYFKDVMGPYVWGSISITILAIVGMFYRKLGILMIAIIVFSSVLLWFWFMISGIGCIDSGHECLTKVKIAANGFLVIPIGAITLITLRNYKKI